MYKFMWFVCVVLKALELFEAHILLSIAII